MQILRDLLLIIPELMLILTLCAVIIVDLTLTKDQSARVSPKLAILGLLLAAGPILGNLATGTAALFESHTSGFSNMIVLDRLSDFFKLLFIAGTIVSIFFTMRSSEIRDYRQGEFYALLLTAVLGAMFLVSSNNFLMLTLSLETLSLCSYVLVGYSKDNRLSSEASMKYILYGSVASGVMLFGLSYIYGMSGTLQIDRALYAISVQETNSLPVVFAFVLVLGGLGFKVAAAPFHFWAPDVYQGAPTPVTAFLSVVSKGAGFSALLRVFLPLFGLGAASTPASLANIQGPLESIIDLAQLPLLFWVISVATMTIGNLVAIRQTDIKRLFAYSSVAHAGYLLMCMTVFTPASLEAMLFYFFVYFFMNLGAFLIIILMIEKTGSSAIESYRGLFWGNPWLAIFMFIFLISLTGLPPTAGFLGKLLLFQVVVDAGMNAVNDGHLTGASVLYLSLAVIGLINSAISLYYYMNIAKLMIFRQAPEGAQRPQFSMANLWATALFAAPTLLLILNFGVFTEWISLFKK